MNTPAALTASVVIATYNRPEQLARVLAGLADQEVPPNEVIVVDDESTPPAAPTFPADGTTTWRLVRQRNGGPAAARDAGIRQATGDVIVIVDDDMIVTPRFVASHLEKHAAGYEVVQGRFDNLASGDQPLYDRFLDDQQRAYFEQCAASDDAILPIRFSTGNVSFRRDRYLACGGFDTSLRRREDSELGLRLAAAGARFGYTHEPTALHDEPGEPLSDYLRMAFEYGQSEAAIHARHPDAYHPWDLLDHMPAGPALLIRSLSRWPAALRGVGWLAAWGAATLERLRVESVAVKAYGFAFVLHWFAGMVTEVGGRPFVAEIEPGTQVVFGEVAVDVVDRDEAIECIVRLAGTGEPSIVVTPNVDHLVLHRRDEAFRRTYDRADLVLADGMPLVLASRLLRLPLREKVSGSDLIMPLLHAAAEAGRRVYILGSAPDVASAAVARITAEVPDVAIVGRASPWFDPAGPADDVAAAFDEIAALDADLVLVAFGAPKQEQLLDRFAERLPGACYVCCGASIDFVAGHVDRAPAWMSRVGLEWLFRLTREPGRLWRRYLVRDMAAIPIFATMVVKRVGRRPLIAHRGQA